ncbi:MFS transporter [soil metagenome]
MQRKWWVLVAVSLMFFFISGSTFSSLGVALFWMKQDLHWTQTEAGASFSVLGLACCLSSLLPMAMINRIGSRWTLMFGGFMLAAGFLVAYLAQGLAVFLVATALLGIGFSLTANIPGVYLLARWFPERSGRIIGVYLMIGASGGVVGPPLAQAVIAGGDWRSLWMMLTIVAALLAFVCLVLIRDDAKVDPSAPVLPTVAAVAEGWRYRDAVLTPQFALLALAMVITETCVTVLHSAGVIHFAKLGMPAEFAALMLSMQAFMATAAKGLSGWLGDWIDPKLLLTVGLLLQGAGMILLGVADTHALSYAFAVAFGIGWGTAYLTITILLINYFGPNTGSAVMSLVWLLTALAALGPAGAGMLADRFGSFTPFFVTSGIVLLPIALAALLMKRPVARASLVQNAESIAAMPTIISA